MPDGPWSSRRQGHSPDPVANRSLHHSLRDGMAFAVMQGGGETFLAAFALFCGANAKQVALLSTLPPLAGSLAQLAGAWTARHAGRRMPVILTGAWLQASMWLPILILPWRFADAAVPLLVLLYTLYFAGASLVAPPWASLMGEIVPERRRGRFFALRTRLNSIMSFTALLCAGVLLHFFDQRGMTRTGFIAIFLAACAARMISAWHLGRMHEPRGTPMVSPFAAVTRKAIGEYRKSGALWFTLYFASMQSAVAVSAPFFAVYMLRDLHFSYLAFTINTGTAVLFQFITLNTWGRISDVFGNRLILLLAGMAVPVLPFLWTVSSHPAWLLTIQCLSGIAWAGFNLSTGNYVYDLVPQTQRAGYIAFHNMIAALGVFIGAMLSSQLIGIVPPRATWLGDPAPVSSLLNLFLVSTAARLLVAILLLERIPELRRPRRRISPRHFVFRVTRFSAFMGLMYEAVDAIRPERGPKRRGKDPGAPS